MFFGLFFGIAVGIISGVFGAGGGIMILVILVFVMGFSMHEGIGTSTLIMAFTAASGTVGHLLTDDLPIKIALLGTLGSIVGSRVSAKYANKVPEQLLCKAASVLFVFLSLLLFLMERSAAVADTEYGTAVEYSASDSAVIIRDPLSEDAGLPWIITSVHEGELAVYPEQDEKPLV